MRSIAFFLLISAPLSAQSWRQATLLPAGPRLNGVTFVEDSIAVAVGDSGRIIRSTDFGSTWSDEERPTFVSIRSIAASRSLVVAVGSGNTILRSTDAGISWSSSTLAKGGFYKVALFDSLHGIIADEMYSTSDGAVSWQKVDLSIPEGGVNDASMLSDSDWIVLTDYGKSGAGTLIRTIDAGSHWQYKAGTPYGNPMSAIFVSGSFLCEVGWLSNPSRGVILCSTDTGSSWERTLLLPGLIPYAITGRNPASLIAIGDSGVLLTSFDSGASWSRITTGTQEHLWSICLNHQGNGVAVGGATQGVAVLGDLPLASVASVKDNLNSVSITVSPNPTGGMISVQGLPLDDITVSVFNIIGETVMVQKNPSAPDFTLDLSKLAPGTYYIRFSSANSVVTKKVVRE
jgi:photosystem II stability/assembly factor-like uncharacterized protein